MVMQNQMATMMNQMSGKGGNGGFDMGGKGDWDKGKGKGKDKGKGKGKGWICEMCGFKNSATNTICGGNGPMGCKAPRPEDWVCPECGFRNKHSNQKCGG